MKPYIDLYIDGNRLEFAEPPRVLITYSHTELHNPSVVKNSFSKTITVDGTPNNNKIFGCFYDMTRLSVYNDVTLSGAYFNASRKVPFELYRNGELMEQGYIKLDKVRKTGNNVQYDITLFGGLGEFLYGLTFKEDGEQMKLSDLDFGGGEKEFDMEVTAKSVIDAWNRVNKVKGWDADTYAIYDKINFAPSYNGIPKDFSADKVAIDVQSFEDADDFDLSEQFIKEKDGYKTIDGWVLGELEKNYDEWQMNDLRSYLQRPVFRFKNIIEACCDPKNNGGYKVSLDPNFFSSNPYYEDAWMTLPLISEIEDNSIEETLETTVTNGTITLKNEGGRVRVDAVFELIAESKIVLDYVVDPNVRPATVYTGMNGKTSSGTKVKFNRARYVQLVAYDATGKVVKGSPIKSFYTNVSSTNSFTYTPEYENNVEVVNGNYEFTKTDFYKFNKEDYALSLSVDYVDGMYFKLVTKYADCGGSGVKGDYLFTNMGQWGQKEYSAKFNTNTIDTAALKTADSKKNEITKKKILNSEKTPCDYFLSYLKMFNLHIWKDMYDKVIYVRQRPNFFINEQYDLEQFVDRGKEISITPLSFENKWLVLQNEGVDSGLYKDYRNEYGIDYGIQKINTNYNFDNSSKNIFEKSAFKSTIQMRGKGRYFVDLHINKTEDIQYPPFMLDGCQTVLFKNGDTTEGAYITPKTTAVSKNLWAKKYYDFMPKPCFSNDKNEPVDGANVLLFYSGKQEVVNNDGDWLWIYVTDDIPQFELLNENEPCWIWTYKSTIAHRPNYLPCFNRYITNDNGVVTLSWDFGTPKYLYVPDYQIDDTSSIYSKYWQSYIRDMYNADTRVVECNVLLKERVLGDWLRRFYYFDGTYWIMNKISDYDVTSDETTKVELVRVNDLNNYLN